MHMPALKIIVPLSIAVFGAFSVVVSYANSVGPAFERIEFHYEKTLRSKLVRAQGQIEAVLQEKNEQLIGRFVSSFGTDESHILMVATNVDGVVFASTNLQLLGQLWDDIPFNVAAKTIADTHARRTINTKFSADKQSLWGIVDICASEPDFGLRRQSCGLLYLAESMKAEKAGALASLRKQAIFNIAGILLGALVLSLFFSTIITGRVRALQLATSGFAKGRRDLRVGLKGKDELSAIGKAIDDMLSEIAASQEALAKSEERFRAIFFTIDVGTIVISREGIVQLFNPVAERIFKYSAEEVVGKNISMLMAGVNQQHHNRYIENYLETGIGQIIGQGRRVIGKRKNGETFQMHLEVSEMQLQQGSGFVGSFRDMTKIDALEAQLRQAQKMEAIGQLTGGIAHDFNNLLAIILGNLSLLSQDLKDGTVLDKDQMQEPIERALEAGERGARLISRLMAFARKQNLKPSPLNINETVKFVEKLLQRTLGQDIELHRELGARDWRAEVDSGQLETALLNLSNNARDAMPNGGVLTITTGQEVVDQSNVKRNVEAVAGDYVTVSVEDTGVGMDAEALDQAFEPFFTTKEVGKGSGLGLSMVYGFIKQSGGFMSINSSLGSGSCVKLYLPRATQSAELNLPPKEKDAAELIIGGSELILVVEDEAGVRKLAARMLTRLGYKVLEAANGREAIETLESRPVDLVLADINLSGGMNGAVLMDAAQKILPDLKILFMSGYTKEIAVGRGHLPENASLLRKPFSAIDIGTKIREALDQES